MTPWEEEAHQGEEEEEQAEQAEAAPAIPALPEAFQEDHGRVQHLAEAGEELSGGQVLRDLLFGQDRCPDDQEDQARPEAGGFFGDAPGPTGMWDMRGQEPAFFQ